MLAERLNVASPSVTSMVKRLSQEDPPLLRYERHRGVELTEAGRTLALRVIRRHRLVELFLCTVLSYTWDEVHEEAERLEHRVSPKLEERIAAYLEYPDLDPHGDPIPTRDGTIARHEYATLSELAPGERGRVRRVNRDQPDLLRYLAGLGVAPSAEFVVTRKEPFGGPIFIRVDGVAEHAEHALGVELCNAVLVERIAPS
jgi:DtxR family Mn-dependent transcriptional regulator